MRVLVVDDSRSVHAYITGLFSETQHELIHAYDGQQALDVLKQNETPFDVVLLDWEMPVLTGPETLERIRLNDVVTPVIMVTTKNDLTSITLALDKGANEYIMKPFTKDILFPKIANVLGKKVA